MKVLDSILSKKIKIDSSNKIYLLAVITGIICGLLSVAFVSVLQLLESHYSSYLIHANHNHVSFVSRLYALKTETVLLTLLVPTIGGLLVGFITTQLAPEAAGTGSNEMIDAFHNKGGQINGKIPFVKSFATIITLSTGGSGGKEGPISQIGAGIGVFISNILKLGERARRTLLLTGTAAGLGAVFHAPLGGALTAVEMVYREDIESDALIPSFIASVTSFLVFGFFDLNTELFDIVNIKPFQWNEMPYFILLGILCYVFGYLLLRGFKDINKITSKYTLSLYLKPAVGGLLVGIIYLICFEVHGTGSKFLQTIINNQIPMLLGESTIQIACCFLVLAFLKIAATTLTIGSGGSAGIFGPSLFIGAMLGASVYYFANYVNPQNEFHLSSFVVVGMGAFYAGIASAPIAGIIMICEITGSYALLPPLILVSIFSFILTKRINLYRSQVDNRFNSPAHLWDMKVDVLKEHSIDSFFTQFRNFAVIKNSMNYNQIIQLSNKIYASDFVVVNEKGNYLGELSLRKMKSEKILADEKNNYKNIIDNKIPAVSSDQSIAIALDVILQYDVDKVAVIENNICKGYLRSRDIFDAYNAIVKK